MLEAEITWTGQGWACSKMNLFRDFQIFHAVVAMDASNFLHSDFEFVMFKMSEIREVILPDNNSTRSPKLDPNHTGFVQGHSNSKCSTDSTWELQIWHKGDGEQLRLNRFSRVAKALEQTLHQKDLILGITSILQTCFQNSYLGDEEDDAVSWVERLSHLIATR